MAKVVLCVPLVPSQAFSVMEVWGNVTHSGDEAPSRSKPSYLSAKAQA